MSSKNNFLVLKCVWWLVPCVPHFLQNSNRSFFHNSVAMASKTAKYHCVILATDFSHFSSNWFKMSTKVCDWKFIWNDKLTFCCFQNCMVYKCKSDGSPAMSFFVYVLPCNYLSFLGGPFLWQQSIKWKISWITASHNEIHAV